MNVDEELEELEERVQDEVPAGISISEVEYEGPNSLSTRATPRSSPTTATWYVTSRGSYGNVSPSDPTPES